MSVVAGARSDDRGEFRLTGLPAGQYVVLARDPAFNVVGDETGALRYGPTYYPGATSVTDAQPVTVTEGTESSRLEFRLRVAHPARLLGTMLPKDRRPLLSGAVILLPRDATLATALPSEDVEILPDGRFTFRNVPPGRYQIRARAEIDANQPMLFGTYAVVVDAHDVVNIQMPLVPGATLHGTIEWDRTSAVPPKNPLGLRVRAPFADGSSFGDALTGEVTAPASFAIRGVMPGAHYISVEGLPQPWAVTAVHLRGRNVIDQPTELIEGETLRDVRIVLSASTSEVSGVVRDRHGKPAEDALVMTLPPILASGIHGELAVPYDANRQGRALSRCPPAGRRLPDCCRLRNRRARRAAARMARSARKSRDIVERRRKRISNARSHRR